MFIETHIFLDSFQPIYGRNEQSHFTPPELGLILLFNLYKYFAATRLRPSCPYRFRGRYV